MGFTDANTIQDGRRLHPLIPRPSAPPACLTCIHGSDFLALNHNLDQQNKRDHLNTQQVVVSSRWNPTPEQLQTLEELYRRGTRTPSAEQIQHITAQLRQYGKIEGKNVFYWFQNHKARERQKRRRQLEHQNQIAHAQTREKIELPPGANRTIFEVEQTKNWASPTNSSTGAAEKIVSREERGGKKGTEDDGWADVDDELHQKRNDTWRMMGLSESNSSNLQISNSSSSPLTVTSTNKDFITIFSDIYTTPLHLDHFAPAAAGPPTLQLFPLHTRLDEEESLAARDTAAYHVAAAPCQFFEFLPLKN